MNLSRYATTYKRVVVNAMAKHLEDFGIILNDIGESGIGVDNKGNLYIIDWGNGFSYGLYSINPDNIDLTRKMLLQQQGGDVSYLHGDAYDMLYDDEFNRRYVISHPAPPYVCFFETKRKKTTVFDTKSGSQDEDMTAYAQSFANSLVSYFLQKMKEKNITVVYRTNSRGCYKFNKDEIDSRLLAMNAILQARCPELRLVLGYSKDLPGELTTYVDGADFLTLCLYIGERCVSSIMLTHTLDDSLDINSRTHDSFQGRGYNKLVRAAIIMVCAVMICGGHRFNYIRSVAENHVSAYTLIKEFDVEVTTPGVALTGDKKTDLAMVKSHYMTHGALTIKVDIAKNTQRATELFDELTATLRCF